MTDLRITNNSGSDKIIEDVAVQELRGDLVGPLLCLGDDGYDETRKVWNGMIDRRPALIARCAGVADVIAAVNFARAHQVLVSVRGGGHNTPGIAVCEGGLMIDLAGMRSVRVDPVQRTARVEGGATWSDFVTRQAGLSRSCQTLFPSAHPVAARNDGARGQRQRQGAAHQHKGEDTGERPVIVARKFPIEQGRHHLEARTAEQERPGVPSPPLCRLSHPANSN